MDFVSFARLHGVMLDYLPPIGEWKAYPTEDKPKKRNGRVKFMGDHGFVQNWATMLTCEMWQPDDRLARPADPVALARAQAEIAAAHRKAIEDRAAKQELAAKNAARILRGSQLSVHPYLAMKGFPEERGNVYARPNKDDPERVDKLLVVPMRIDGHLVGCQMIDEAGGKKFLTGQRTTDAVFVMDNHGRAILTEGYATALSVRTALTQLRMRFKLIVCFSAGNLARIAETLPNCFIVADRDSPTEQVPEPGGMGLKVALESKRPFWIADEEGVDFNDHMRNVGIFKASQHLRSAMR